MARHTLPQLSTAPLRRYAEQHGQTLHGALVAAGWKPSHNAMRLSIGWQNADRFACALGAHPCEIWGAEWWQVAAAYEIAEQERPERQRAALRARRAKRRREVDDAAWAPVFRSYRQWFDQLDRRAA